MSKIITSEDLSDYMGKTLVNGRAEPVVNAVNQWIESRTGRCWGETKQETRRFGYKRTIWLRRMDIVSIDSVETGIPGQTQDAVSADSYYLDDLGAVNLGSFGNSPFANIRDYIGITYTYGKVEVPDDLKLAALGIAAGYYNWATEGNKEIVSTSVGSYRVEYSGRGNSQAKTTSDANFAIVESYKVRRI
jgi:hypothetical protein